MKKATSQQTNVTLADIHAVIPAIEGAELDALRADIKLKGQLVPILVNGQTVIDGRARLKICEELGISPITHDLGSAANDADWAISTNLFRRHLTTAQRAFIAEKLASLRKGSNQHTATAACSRQEAAIRLGVSEDSIDRARNIREKGCSKLLDMVTKNGLSLDAAAKLVKHFPSHIDQEAVIEKGTTCVKKEIYKKEVIDVKRANAQLLAKNNGAALATLKGTYSVIYADPPWDYHGNSKGSHCDPAIHYPLMTTKAIMALPVKQCLTKDAALYLWVPSCLLEDGLEVIKAWGFKYVSQMVWCKSNAVIAQGPTKTAHELLLIGSKGNALHDTKMRLNSWVQAPTTAHSKKPEIFARMIDDMYPGFPKLEMFARAPRSNEWSVFGNQVVKKGGVKTVNKSAATETVARSKSVKPVKKASSVKSVVMKQLFAANDPRSQIAA